jgi:DUF4097 and DUF4098 domain-containing protein YvlB
MSEERTRILKLLEDGKITADQAARLIEALGQARSDEEPGFPPIPPIPPIPPLRRTYFRRHGVPGIDQIPDIVAKAVSSAVRTSRVGGETVRRFEGVRSLSVKTVSGDVEVAGTGEPGSSVTSDGSPRVSESGGELEVNSVSDDVGTRVPRTAEVSVKTVSGDVVAAQFEGALAVATVSGDVEAVEARGGVRVATVSGDVELTRVAGELAIETRSGDVDIVPGGALWGEVAGKSGDVTLLVRPDADLLLELETEDGEIDVDLEAAHETVESTDQRRQVKLGAGSKTLKVRTVSGDITVRDDSEEQ